MKIRLSILSSLVIALLAPISPSASAAPLVSIGDNADLFFNGSSSLRWTSNVFRDEDDEVDDFWWTLSPGFELNLGRGLSNLDFSVVTSYEIRRYMDLDELDTELFSIQADGTYRTSRLDLGGSAFFREQKRSTGDVNRDNELIESENFGGKINGEYRFSPKFSFGAGFTYDVTEYLAPFDDNFADRERYSVPLDVFYELTPKVDLSVGYTYSETDVSSTPPFPFGSGIDSFTTEDHFINVGARGKLLPKLTGFFKVGYRVRDTDKPGSSSRGTLGLDADLTWTATPKLTNRLAFSRDFGVSGEGSSTENTSLSLTSNYSLNSFFGATVFADYTLREYIDMNVDDNQYRLGARLNYTPNRYWRFEAGYTYSENDSERINASYIAHTVDITASLRY